MIARLKGRPFTISEGDLRISLTKPLTSVNALAKEAFRKHPVTIVLRHVAPNSATFTQGNFCGRACSNSISAGGLNELSMKLLSLSQFSAAPPRTQALWRDWWVRALLQRLQVFAWFKAYCFSGRDVYFRTGSRVSTDPCLPRLYGKHSEATQLDPIVGLEGIFHTIEDRIYSLFRFRLAYSRPLHDLIHKIEFNHWNLRIRLKPTTTIRCTYF